MHASYDLLLSLLLQLRLLLRVLLRAAAAVAAGAAALCCHGFLKVGLPEATSDHYEIKWVSRWSARFWTYLWNMVLGR